MMIGWRPQAGVRFWNDGRTRVSLSRGHVRSTLTVHIGGQSFLSNRAWAACSGDREKASSVARQQVSRRSLGDGHRHIRVSSYRAIRCEASEHVGSRLVERHVDAPRVVLR